MPGTAIPARSERPLSFLISSDGTMSPVTVRRSHLQPLKTRRGQRLGQRLGLRRVRQLQRDQRVAAAHRGALQARQMSWN